MLQGDISRMALWVWPKHASWLQMWKGLKAKYKRPRTPKLSAHKGYFRIFAFFLVALKS